MLPYIFFFKILQIDFILKGYPRLTNLYCNVFVENIKWNNLSYRVFKFNTKLKFSV